MLLLLCIHISVFFLSKIPLELNIGRILSAFGNNVKVERNSYMHCSLLFSS